MIALGLFSGVAMTAIELVRIDGRVQSDDTVFLQNSQLGANCGSQLRVVALGDLVRPSPNGDCIRGVELLGRFNQHDGTGRAVRPPSRIRSTTSRTSGPPRAPASFLVGPHRSCLPSVREFENAFTKKYSSGGLRGTHAFERDYGRSCNGVA